MRILFVLPDLPHPPFTGAHTRPLTLMRAAAQRHEIAAVGAAPSGADLSVVEELCADVRVAPASGAKPAGRRAAASGRRLVSPVPLVSRGRSATLARLVDAAVEEWLPDAMMAETLYAAHYRVAGLPLIVDLPEVPSGLCESAAAARPLRYLAANLQAATSRRYERRLLDDTIPVTINDGDRDRLATLGVEAYTIPLAFDLPPEDALYDRASRARHDEAVRLLFIGSFVHEPNRDAARFLVRRLAPELRTERVPFAMVIAGLQAPPWLRKAGGAGVTVMSDAPDLEPLYRSADIVLAPLPHGGGTKNKTLEAMAWGLPVLGTTQAFTGLPQLDGRAFVCDPLDPLVFARRIRALRDDPELRLHLGMAARDHVAAAHAPELAATRAAALFDAVTAGGGVAEAEALARVAGPTRVAGRSRAIHRSAGGCRVRIRTSARTSESTNVPLDVRGGVPAVNRLPRRGRAAWAGGHPGSGDRWRISWTRAVGGGSARLRRAVALGHAQVVDDLLAGLPGIERLRRAVRRPDVGALEPPRRAGEVLHLLEHAGRAAGHHGAGGDVVHDDRPGADQRSLADLDAGQDGAVGADARQAAHHGPALAVFVPRAPHRVRVVGEDDVGPDEDVVLDGHELQEAAAVDAHAAADAIAELEHRVGADADVVAQAVVLTDARALAGLQAVADDAAGVDGGERAHDGAGADGERALALAGAPRRLADDAGRLQVVPLAHGHVGVQGDVGRHDGPLFHRRMETVTTRLQASACVLVPTRWAFRR